MTYSVCTEPGNVCSYQLHEFLPLLKLIHVAQIVDRSISDTISHEIENRSKVNRIGEKTNKGTACSTSLGNWKWQKNQSANRLKC